MNYRNGRPTDVTVAKDASVRKYVTEGRYNAIFMTYGELLCWAIENEFVETNKMK